MDADATVMPLLPRHRPACLALLAVALLAGGCGGVQAATPGKLSAEETEAFLERSGEGEGLDYECASASGAWDYECVFTRDGSDSRSG